MSGASFHVTVSNTSGSVNSNNAVLTVSASVVLPSITTQPNNVTTTVGAAASLSVVATGTNLTYQWFEGGTTGATGSGGSAVSGATTATYSLTSVTLSNAGNYYVVVTNTSGSVTSQVVTLTVTEVLPTITTQPVAVSVASGTSAAFTVVASGTNLTYQWYEGGTSGATASSSTGGTAVAGATGATLTIASTTTTQSGNTYYAKVSNSAGSVYTTIVSLTVGSGIDLLVTPQAIEGPFWVDENLKLSNLLTNANGRTTVTGGFPLTLTFTLYNYNATTSSGVPLSGAHIDIWHADAIGTYSDEASGAIQSENTVGQTWLRGYQVTDSNGAVSFSTIHPGWYTGRTPHIHVRVRTYDSSGNVTYNLTTQMFFTDAQNAAVLAATIYQHGTRTVFNANDNVYSVLQSDGTTVGSHLMLNVTQGSSSETANFSLAFVL
jgi:protocatechuate 3,4-dioxygenase beta subunit